MTKVAASAVSSSQVSRVGERGCVSAPSTPGANATGLARTRNRDTFRYARFGILWSIGNCASFLHRRQRIGHGRCPRPLTALVLLVSLAANTCYSQASADPPAQAPLAVVRLPSHGASATVIATEPGKTLLLGCAHAFQGTDRTKPIVVDVPTAHPQSPRHVGTQLLKVNYEDDLSLVLLFAGPVAYVCPVAAMGHRPGQLVSVGYDEMRLPAQVLPAHIVHLSADITYTRERPWHGRSGGALIDSQAGSLVGVVQGYEITGPCRGMYVSHRAILRFLAGEPWKTERPLLSVPPSALGAPLLYPPGRS